MSTSSGAILSPSRQLYTLANEHSQQHQSTIQRHTDSRLPPDLLPYGQHQSLVLQSSLKNSSSSSTGSSTSTAILQDHRNHTTNGTNRFAFYTDDRLSETFDDDDDDETDMQQLFVRHTPIEEPDLRIYHNDNVLTKASKSYGKLNSPSPTITTNSVMAATNKLTPSNPHRTTNIYELTPASAILTPNYGPKQFGKANASKSSTLQRNAVAKVIDNDSSVNCKPRQLQSVVRTSPSFSFLSTGYNQQDNFLWCFGPTSIPCITLVVFSLYTNNLQHRIQLMWILFFVCSNLCILKFDCISAKALERPFHLYWLQTIFIHLKSVKTWKCNFGGLFFSLFFVWCKIVLNWNGFLLLVFNSSSMAFDCILWLFPLYSELY